MQVCYLFNFLLIAYGLLKVQCIAQKYRQNKRFSICYALYQIAIVLHYKYERKATILYPC